MPSSNTKTERSTPAIGGISREFYQRVRKQIIKTIPGRKTEREVEQAEDLGVTHFGVGEGPLLFSDPYQFLALAAQQIAEAPQRGERLIDFVGDRGNQLPHSRDAVRVGQFGLHLAIATLALTDFFLRQLALRNV